MIQSAQTRAPERAIGFTQEAVSEISSALRQLLADIFTLYLKTKNFHWRMTGRHFRDYHLLLEEHAEQILTITDEIAERARKIGGPMLRSVGDIARLQRLKDNDADHVTPREMLIELRVDNLQLTKFLLSTHKTCGEYGDVATTSLIETWIYQTECRSWFLAEIAGEI